MKKEKVAKMFYTIEEASELTGIAIGTLRLMKDRREIAFYKPGKRVLFSREDLLAFMNRHREESAS